MSKELIVAGSIVAACVGLTVVAFVKPGDKPEATDAPDLATTEPIDRWSTSTSVPPASTTSFPPVSTDTPFTSLPPVDPVPVAPVLPVAPIQPIVPVEPIPVAPPPASVERTHTVAKGDTLGEISKQYYGTTKHWKKIRDINQCDENGLAVGQKLTIPAIDEAPPTSIATTGDSSTEGLYVVKKGDSYYRIAERELGSASRARDIEKLNGIAADDLRPGQKLVLPPRSTTASSSSSASTTSSTAVEVPPGSRVHVVGKDEYLVDISEKYYGSTSKWKRIADANPGVNPNRLRVGQKLVIPDVAPASGSSSSSAATVVVGGGTYTVQPKDTLEKIAKNLLGDGSKWRDIAKLNPGVDPERLMVGQKLVVPEGAKVESSTSNPPATSFPAPSTLPAPSTFPAPAPAPSTFPAPAPSPSFPAPSSNNPFPGASAAPAPAAPEAFPPADDWNLPELAPEPQPEPVPAPPPAQDPWEFPNAR